MELTYSKTVTIVGTVATFIFGKWDVPLKIIVCLTVLDFLSGIMKAVYTNTISSRVGYKGIVRKAGILTVIIVANLLDLLTGVFLFRTAIIFFFASTESISLIENIGAMDVPIPRFLKEKLIQLRDSNNEIKK